MKSARLDHRERALRVIQLLRRAVADMVEPASIQVVATYGKDPFCVLVACILSLRTKDTVSLPAALRLLDQARTPQALISLPQHSIQSLIYPVGFYRRKATTLQAIAAQLLDKHQGHVPATLPELLALPGVGLKTANLVLAEGFGIPALCVDTHVHRISNRLGLVATKTPEQTEQALRELLPRDCWADYNRLMVMWGQNICVPISPRCSSCVLAPLCPKVGVRVSR